MPAVNFHRIRRAWEDPAVSRYYAFSRNRPEELYPSERFFLDRLLRGRRRVLDIGCACGGMYNILRRMGFVGKYTGVDVSRRMIAEGRRLFPEAELKVSPADRLPFRSRCFDLVLALGLLPMVTVWRRVLREAWRVCRRDLLLDVRLTTKSSLEDPRRSYQRLAFFNRRRGRRVPYVVVNVMEFWKALAELRPAPARVHGYGYFHAVSPMARTPYPRVCMAAFHLARRGSPRLRWDLPLPRPAFLPR